MVMLPSRLSIDPDVLMMAVEAAPAAVPGGGSGDVQGHRIHGEDQAGVGQVAGRGGGKIAARIHLASDIDIGGGYGQVGLGVEAAGDGQKVACREADGAGFRG